MRQFPGFADGDKSGADIVRNRRAQDVAARFNGDDVVDASALEAFDEKVDCFAKALLIFEQGGDVAEKDPGNRKIRDRSNQRFDLHASRV